MWSGDEQLEVSENEYILIQLCEAVNEDDLSVKITTSDVSGDGGNEVTTSIRLGSGKLFKKSMVEILGEAQQEFSNIKRVSLMWRQPGEKTMYLASTEFQFFNYYINDPTPTALHKAIVTTL